MKWPVVLALPLAACAVGPDYVRPAAPAPAAFKELAGWKPAAPQAELDKGAWWSVFDDPVLDGLERQVAVTNQNVVQAEAAYRQSLALLGEAQASLFPTVTAGPAVTRQSRNSSFALGSAGQTAATGKAITQYSLEGNASWSLDVWGRIRRQIE